MSKVITVQDGNLTLSAVTGNLVVSGSDIANPATPDTATIEIELHSLDGNLFGTIGYRNGEDFEMVGHAHGSAVSIISEDSGGTEQYLFTGNADNRASLYHTGNLVLNTDTTGIHVQGLLSNNPATGGVQDALITLVNAGVQSAARIGFSTDSEMQIVNTVQDGTLVLYGRNTALSEVDLINLDPNGEAAIFYAGAQKLATTTLGIDVTGEMIMTGGLKVGDAFSATFNSNSEQWISATVNGPVLFYHNGNQVGFTDQAGMGTNDGLYFAGSSNHAYTPGAGTGALWLDSDDDTLYFRADSGTDFAVAGPSIASVTSTGSPLSNEVAVFVDADTIDSDSTFTWDSSTLVVSNFSIGATFMGNTGASRSAFRAITASATIPNIHVSQSDVDTGIGGTADALALISGGVEMLRLSETGTAGTDQVIISPGATLRGAAATPLLAFGDGDSGFYETLDDILSLSLAGTQTWNFASGSFEGNATDAAALLNSGATATVPTVVPVKTDTNTGIGSAAADQLSLITGGIEANRIIASTLQTTTAATTEIESIAVPSDEGFGFEIHVMGTDDTNNDVVFERIFGAIYNATGTTALVGSTITDRTDTAGASGWTITVAADDTTDALTVDVTGAAVNIDWKCRINILNV